MNIITRHVILHARANLLREIRLALEYAILLRIRSVVLELTLGREEAPALYQWQRYYRSAGRRDFRAYAYPRLFARLNGKREIGDFRRFHGIVQQHLHAGIIIIIIYSPAQYIRHSKRIVYIP